jgi:hypothetical protein
MPRRTGDEIAGANFRNRNYPRPKPPEWLSLPAKAIFAAIISDRPIEWFRPGSVDLLAQYAAFAAEFARGAAQLENIAAGTPAHDAEIKHLARISAACISLANACRISVQSGVHRRASAVTEERGIGDDPDRLLGGFAVWGDKKGLFGRSLIDGRSDLFGKGDAENVVDIPKRRTRKPKLDAPPL